MSWKSLQVDSPIYAVFVDFERTYDNMNRDKKFYNAGYNNEYK